MDSISSADADILLNRRANAQRSAATRSSSGSAVRTPRALQGAVQDLTGGGEGNLAAGGQGESNDRSAVSALMNDRTTTPSAVSNTREPVLASLLGSSQSTRSASRPGDWAYSLFHNDNSNGRCGGRIGMSDNFCLSTKVCSTGSHVRNGHAGCVSDRVFLRAIHRYKRKELAICVKECSYELTLEDFEKRKLLIRQVDNVLAGEHITEDEAIREFQEFKVLADDLAEVSMDIEHTGTFGDEIAPMLTARDGNEDEDLMEVFEESVSLGQDGRSSNGNLSEQLSAESNSRAGSTGERLGSLLRSMSQKMQAQQHTIHSLLLRVDALDDAKLQAEEIYIRKDEWRRLYREDCLQYVSSKSHRLTGVEQTLSQVGALRERVEDLEDFRDNGRAQNLGAGQFDSSPETSFETLKADLVLMENRLGAESITFGDITLSSCADTLLFITDAMAPDIMSYSYNYDLMALLDAVVDPNKGFDQQIKEEFEAKRAEYTSVREATTSASFSHIAPLVLGGAKNSHSHGSMDRMFGAVKNRSDWSSQGGTLGLKRYLDAEVSNVSKGASQAIQHDLKGYNNRAAALAQAMLADAKECYYSFVTWTESFYMEIKDISEVTEKEAWSLILECWGAFFGELRKVRGVAANQSRLQAGQNVNLRTQKTAFNIYTMAKATKLQREFKDAEFKNHPVIATVINYHLFQYRVPSSVFSGFRKEYNLWKSQITRDVKKLTDRA